MAKQSSLFKLRGKADGQSFYYSKNGEYLTRKINPGMSSRVKTAKEYANTRLNNAEFGAAGACAGAMVRAVSSRWRYILNSIATGMLVKGIKEAMMQDTTHDWGKRGVLLADMPAIQDLYNRFSKNEIPSVIKEYADNELVYNSTNGEIQEGIAARITEEYANELISLGADKVKTTAYVFAVHAPKIGADGETYMPESVVFAEILNNVASPVEGDTMISIDGENVPASVQNADARFGGVLFIVEPLKTVGGKDYVLQQHCSAYWKSIESA